MENKEWDDFLLFIENMFSDSPHCCSPKSADYFYKMMDKLRDILKDKQC